jgi:hypothetical protein
MYKMSKEEIQKLVLKADTQASGLAAMFGMLADHTEATQATKAKLFKMQEEVAAMAERLEELFPTE